MIANAGFIGKIRKRRGALPGVSDLPGPPVASQGQCVADAAKTSPISGSLCAGDNTPGWDSSECTELDRPCRTCRYLPFAGEAAFRRGFSEGRGQRWCGAARGTTTEIMRAVLTATGTTRITGTTMSGFVAPGLCIQICGKPEPCLSRKTGVCTPQSRHRSCVGRASRSTQT